MDLTSNIAANLSAWMAGTPSLDTIKKVASRAGVGFGTVRRARNGTGNPTIKNLGDIARAFGRRVEDLLADPQSGITLRVSEPQPTPYNARMDELIGYLNELDQQEIEIYTQELKLAALKARRKKQELEDRLPAAGPGDPNLEGRRTA